MNHYINENVHAMGWALSTAKPIVRLYADNIFNVCRRVSEKGKNCTKDSDCCTRTCLHMVSGNNLLCIKLSHDDSPFRPGYISWMVVKSVILLAMSPNEEASRFALSNTPFAAG
ncbi:hypothetical protein P692DRAFT_20241020 [Suillus brevipes Sb2]|nr:hypothetical protein P692DRAFT_20241020 [Suillus brevipes Sb2]